MVKRGVRKGHPLSSLFVIVMDFLAKYMVKLVAIGAICLPFPDMKPSILYVDDMIFFVKLETQQL